MTNNVTFQNSPVVNVLLKWQHFSDSSRRNVFFSDETQVLRFEQYLRDYGPERYCDTCGGLRWGVMSSTVSNYPVGVDLRDATNWAEYVRNLPVK